MRPLLSSSLASDGEACTKKKKKNGLSEVDVPGEAAEVSRVGGCSPA